MRLLVLGLDTKVLDQTSATYKRIKHYADALDWYEVVVPSKRRMKIVDGNLTVVGVGGFIKPIQLILLMYYAYRAIKKHNISVVTSQDPYVLGLTAVFLGKLLKVGVEVQVHGFEKFNIVRREIAEHALHNADVIRVVSKDLKKRIHSYFGIENAKIIVAPIFVDWKAIQYTEFDHRIKAAAKDHTVFLAVGRMVSVKNFEGIIRAFYHVHKEHPHTHLLLVGDGPLKPKLMGEVRELGIEDVVEFVGWVDSVIEYYRGSHCGIFFSESEGYGMALIEALACQLPVITTKVGVAQDIVKDGVNGLFVDRDDVESLEKLMKLLVVNTEMREQMKKQSRHCLEELPTQDNIEKQYHRAWKKVERATKRKRL
ncbi:MAG: glycosyltransferase family 4 protein [Patescibacteria group bacterium]